jgi:hypothetical protein
MCALSEVNCNQLHPVGIAAGYHCLARGRLGYGEYRVRLGRICEADTDDDQAVRNAYHRCILQNSQSIAYMHVANTHQAHTSKCCK